MCENKLNEGFDFSSLGEFGFTLNDMVRIKKHILGGLVHNEIDPDTIDLLINFCGLIDDQILDQLTYLEPNLPF